MPALALSASSRLARRIGALLMAAAVALAAVAPAGAAPPLWRIQGSQAEIVLFGSVHMLREGADWRFPELDEALAGAQSIWFEVLLDPATRARGAEAAAREGLLSPGRTLSQLMSASQKDRLTRVAHRLGLSLNELDPLQPWAAELALSYAALQRRGARLSFGVEERLWAAAPEGIERRAFETPEDQVRLFASAPLDQQLASLQVTVRELERNPRAFDQLQRAWVAGDTAWLEREQLAPLREAVPALYERLVVARNRAWADEIERLLQTPERAFIVVGVGHLLGPDSVPDLLRRRGVVVEGP